MLPTAVKRCVIRVSAASIIRPEAEVRAEKAIYAVLQRKGCLRLFVNWLWRKCLVPGTVLELLPFLFDHKRGLIGVEEDFLLSSYLYLLLR